MFLACMILGLFGLVAATDGFYFHWWRFRLSERPESRREHLLHTLNSCLFPFQLYLMFCVRPTGAWLWLLTAVTIGSFALEMIDVFGERESRRAIGGLTTAEYALHFLMSGLRTAYVVLVYAGYELADFTAPASLTPQLSFYRYFGLCFLAASIAMALWHIILYLQPLQPLRASAAGAEGSRAIAG